MKPILPLAFLIISQIGLSLADYSGEAKTRQGSAGDVVKPRGPKSSEYKGDCELTEALYNVSATLSSSQQQVMNQFVQYLIDTILVEVNLTSEEMVVQCSYAVKHFCEENPDIAQLMLFMQIGSWGCFEDWIYVSIDLQATISVSVITLDSNDDCPLFDALLNATNGNSAQQSAVIELIAEIKAILSESSWTMAQKMAQISIQLSLFFEVHASWEASFLEIEISGFGTLESFMDVCKGYDRALTVGKVVSGSGDNDCPLLGALTNLTANTSLSLSERNQIKDFHDKCEAYFANVTDVALRLAYVSAQYYQLEVEEPWLIQILMTMVLDVDGSVWGTFYDLEWCSQFCKNSGSCGNLDNGLGTTPQPTTSSPPYSCAARSNLITITSQNTTILTDVLTTNYNSWNSSVKLSFNTYFNLIRQDIWNSTATMPQRINQVVVEFQKYMKNQATYQSIVMSIYISAWGGTIQQFCNCPSA